MTTLPQPGLESRRYWLSGVLLLLCGFLAGMLCGGSLVARHLLSKIQKGMEYPESRVEEVMMRMSRNLDLTPDQQQKIRTILVAQEKELSGLRQQILPKVSLRLEQTEKAVAEILDPQQREKWRGILADNRRQWGPPGGRGGGRMPPGGFGGENGRRPGEGRPGPGNRPEGGLDPERGRPQGLQRRNGAGGIPGQRPARQDGNPPPHPSEANGQRPPEALPEAPPPES